MATTQEAFDKVHECMQQQHTNMLTLKEEIDTMREHLESRMDLVEQNMLILQEWVNEQQS